MEIYRIVLILHVISGFTALFGGLVPMLAKKGSKLHVRGGWVYFYAMTGVLISTIALFLMKPNELLFLLLVGIFSFYIAFSGVRAVRFKRPKNLATALDWGVAGLVAICGLIMMGLSLVNFFTPAGSFDLGVLFLVFGGICTIQAFSDLFKFRKLAKGLPLKEPWLVAHIIKMGGAYIATCTAFFVVNIHFLPGLLVWLTPTVIGSFMIGYTLKKYKKRLKQT